MTATDRGAAQPPRRLRLPFSKRLLLVWGSVLAVVVLLFSGVVTMAAFTDTEHAKVTGIGTGSFNLQISEDGTTWKDQTTADEPLVITIPGADKLIPGVAVETVTFQVRNAGDYTSSLQLEIVGSGDSILLQSLNLQAKTGSGSYVDLVVGEPQVLSDLAPDEVVTVTVGLQLDVGVGNELLGNKATLAIEVTGQSKAA